jgi:hypothetical protein
MEKIRFILAKEVKMKNKPSYEKPEITLIQWTIEDDIITTSGGDTGDWDTDM